MTRTKVSAPTQWLLDNNILNGDVLHFGEGKAFQDTAAMKRDPNVHMVVAYDPNSYNPLKRQVPDGYYTFVVSNYVLNVLTEGERRAALNLMLSLGDRVIITVRTDKVKGTVYEDGVITSRDTFQAQLTPVEWALWVFNMAREWQPDTHVSMLHGTRNYLMLEVC